MKHDKKFRHLKQFAIFCTVIYIALAAAGCGSKTKTSSVSLDVDTGDSVRISIPENEEYEISFDKEKSIINISGGGEGDVLVQGIFVPQNSYSLYYETAYTDSRCSISEEGRDNGISYTYYIYEENGESRCEYIGWIIGSNTGVVFESTVLDEESCISLMKKLSFSVQSTSQKNGEYCFVPDINRQDETPHKDESPNEEDGQGNTGEDHAQEGKADWTSLAVKIDGVEYQFPYSYKKLQENGWKLYGDISDYISGGEDQFILSEGEYTYSTTRLVNPAYGEELGSAEIYAGFKNYGKEDKDILDCDLWAMEISAVYGTSPTKKAPEVILPGGVSFGVSYDDIIRVYGKPDAEEETEYYKRMDYENGYSQHMTLYVYGNGLGLLGVEMQGYQ